MLTAPPPLPLPITTSRTSHACSSPLITHLTQSLAAAAAACCVDESNQISPTCHRRCLLSACHEIYIFTKNPHCRGYRDTVQLYAQLAEAGLMYGPAFRLLRNVHVPDIPTN